MKKNLFFLKKNLAINNNGIRVPLLKNFNAINKTTK